MEIYNGCKNTFVITMYEKEKDNPEFARIACQNQYDGCILVKSNPLEMVMYNQDGSEASMCGNGIRVFIHYCDRHGLLSCDINLVQTKSGLVKTEIISRMPFLVKVWMNESKSLFHNQSCFPVEMNIHHRLYQIYLIHTGVWHGVIIPDNFEVAIQDAEEIYNNSFFNHEVNIDFVAIHSYKEIYVKTYERGVGFTSACGTGVMAAYLTLRKRNMILENDVDIKVDGGTIKVGVCEDGPYIIGPSETINKNS